MHKKQIRILPLGYFLIMALLFFTIILIAFFIRLNSAPEKLYYALTHNKVDSYDAYFSLTTMGDAVNYKNKSIHISYEVHPMDGYTYCLATLSDEMDNPIPIQLYITQNQFFFKDKHMTDFSILNFDEVEKLFSQDMVIELNKLIHLIEWESSDFQSILKSNTLQMKSSLNDAIYFAENSKQDILVTFTLDMIFDALRDVASNMILHESFESEILSFASEVYELKGNNAIIKFFDLNTTVMLDNLVDFKINFEHALYDKIDLYEGIMTSIFSPESEVTIHFTLSDTGIQHVAFTAELSYNSCDASEWIEWNYSKIKPIDVASPRELKTLPIESYIPLIQSYFELMFKH